MGRLKKFGKRKPVFNGNRQEASTNSVWYNGSPPPTAKFNFCTSQLLKCPEEVAKKSVTNAIEEAVALNENSRDITAAFDGSWQKRGHTSLNGVITATSLDNGKVIDVECLTKFCHNCKSDQPGHVCMKNYDGFSGGMESDGVVNIFQRSENLYQVRYVNYLGDGDSKGYKKVEELNVYGNVKVSKLECCEHVQKRMGTRLRKLCKDMKGKKCSDGKPLTGRGRLTDSAIDQLQTYYGLAIRRNAGKDVEKVRRAVWAIYFHKYSTDEEPYHTLCPPGTDEDCWCGYNKASVTGNKYSHQHSLPPAVMDEIKPIFRDLSNQELLKKCLHGNTQNPNESFNHCIWERIPKTVFVGLKTLKQGVLDAVICFNDGCVSRLNVLESLGIEVGPNTKTALYAIDKKRFEDGESLLCK
ncbi:hypothetical protein ANN_27440 [Periplaneta americana]|uniref:Mutator-like transposase domain-containing protein n=1 Tax=Periplaneta americana TaxID=6978 RepID=A0ABQ8RVT1_PERAM|nr:hypothetical protein ANN_27440 [Periplaneta americana]